MTFGILQRATDTEHNVHVRVGPGVVAVTVTKTSVASVVRVPASIRPEYLGLLRPIFVAQTPLAVIES